MGAAADLEVALALLGGEALDVGERREGALDELDRQGDLVGRHGGWGSVRESPEVTTWLR